MVYTVFLQFQLKETFNCPEEIVYPDGKVERYPVHKSNIPFNFENSAGLAYEAEEAKRCIDKGNIFIFLIFN